LPRNDRHRARTDPYERGVEAHAAGTTDAAEAEYREAASAGDPGAAYQLGLILRDRNDLPGAADAYGQAAAAGHLEATLNLALLFGEVLNRPEEARDLYRVAIESGDLRAILDFAFFLWAEGQLGEAEAVLQRGIAAGEPRAYLHLGFLLADQDREEEALAAFRQATNAGVEVAWTHVGWQLARLGRLDEAEQALRRAWEVGDPASAVVLHDVLDELDRSTEAEAVLQRAIDDSTKTVSMDYRELLQTRDGEDLRTEELERWTREELDSPAPLALATLLFDASRLAEAETRLKLAVEHGDCEANDVLAQLYEKTGRHDDAEAVRSNQ
jgi:uncharacterized protein